MKRKKKKKEREGETKRERERFAEISLFLLASTVISAKLKLPKEVSFASPSTHPLTLTHPNSSFSYLSRTPLWFGVLLTLGTSLPPANQPTNQPRASLMLLLQISGRLLGCLPAGTIGRCVFPSSSRLSSFFNPFFLLSFGLYTSFRRLFDAYVLSSLHARVYILFYVTLLYYLSHFPRIPIRSWQLSEMGRKWTSRWQALLRGSF